MGKIKNAPPVLQRKMLLTFLIGAACLLVGLAVSIVARDRIMLALSGVVCLLSAAKGLSLYRLIDKKKYETVEGTCVSIANRMIRKYRKVKIMDDSGVESSLLLSKHSKIKIGFRYRFYFKDTERLTIGSAYFDTALASDSFLGYEELGEVESELSEQEEENPREQTISRF